jgi:hypothetical protein
VTFGKVRARDHYPSSAVTAGDGLFAIPTKLTGACELRVFDHELGGGAPGPIVLDSVQDHEGLELELSVRPGAIEGRVLFPPGHGPEEVWLFSNDPRALELDLASAVR